MSYVRFPPGRGSLLIPLGSATAARMGVSMWAACRPVPRVARTVAWWLAGTLGGRLLPGGRQEWRPPLGDEIWREMLAELRLAVGGFDSLAVYHQFQPGREGFAAVLVEADRPRAFVKVRSGGSTSLAIEAAAQDAASRATTVRASKVIGMGEVGGWAYLVSEPLPNRRHDPPHRPPIEVICEELGELLGTVPGRPPSRPDWRPMHGDLAPWNLRRVPGEGLFLFDFEHVGWAPPGADLLFYRASAHATGLGEKPKPGDYQEAAAYWRSVIPSRFSSGRSDRLIARQMLAALEQPDGPDHP